MADAYALRLSEAELQRYAFMAQAARTQEADLWTQAGIGPGAHLADVGCGPGALFPALVDVIGPAGHLTGVDGTAEAVAAARALVQAHGWANVEVREGRTESTGLPAGSFDVVMMRHVLAHNQAIESQIVGHLAELVRPGGHVYLVDIAASTMAVRPSDPDVDDLNAHYLRWHALRGNDLDTGLRLRELLDGAGLQVQAYRGWFTIIQPPQRGPTARLGGPGGNGRGRTGD